jgi:hypothetical protein
LFLLLEEDGVVLAKNIVALIRHNGRTRIVMRDNSARESRFTPATLDKRSQRFQQKTQWRDNKFFGGKE